jgi:hypothetical protein
MKIINDSTSDKSLTHRIVVIDVEKYFDINKKARHPIRTSGLNLPIYNPSYGSSRLRLRQGFPSESIHFHLVHTSNPSK